MYVKDASCFKESCVWIASSRVGKRIKERVLDLGASFSNIKCNVGSKKVAVFPLPVCADTIISLPSCISGMIFFWTSVASINESFSRAFSSCLCILSD